MSKGSTIEARLNTIAGAINVQYGALVDLIIELRHGPDDWSGDGVWTVEQFLAWRTGVSPTTASALTIIASRAEDLPVCIQAFREGRLSLDQAASIARRAPWWTDADSCSYATLMTVTQLRSVLAKYPFPALDEDGREVRPVAPADTEASNDAADEVEPEAAPATDVPPPDDVDTYCSWSFGDDGSLNLHARLDAESGGVVAQALDEARDQLFQHGHADATNADALREVCERSLDGIDSPSRRSRFKLSMFFETNGDLTDADGRRVPDSVRQHVSCDGTVTPVLLDNGLPVSIGRAQHIVPERVRTLIERRDHNVCRVPGCTSRLGLEVHHIIHWEHDGPTDTWNLVLICGHHHRMHHRGRLGIDGNADQPDGITFISSRGRVLRRTGAAPNPPGGPPAPPPAPYQHPVGERLQLDAILFTPPAAHRKELRQRVEAAGGTATDYLNSFRSAGCPGFG